MFIVHLLLSIFFAQTVLAAPPPCEKRLVALATKPIGIQIEEQAIEKMADLLSLSRIERANVKAYAAYAAEVLEARSAKRHLLTLHSAHLNRQSEKLQEIVGKYIANWPQLKEAVMEMYDASIDRLRGEIDDLEKDLRSGKGEDVSERNKNSIRDLLNRVSLKHYGKPADIENFSWAIETLSANPERQLFRMKQDIPKRQEEVKAKKQQASLMADRALKVLTQIQTLLKGRGDDIDLQTLVQLELALGTVDELGSWGFLIPAGNIGQDVDLRDNYGITFEKVEAGLTAWSSRAAKNIGSDVYEFAKSRIEDAKNSGMILLPIIGTFSHKESLALAFLPIMPLRFQHERAWVSDLHPGPQRGAAALDSDMSGTRSSLRYDNALLRERNPGLWLETLNRSFNNWYLMLGGNPDWSGPLNAANSVRESLIQTILYSARYMSLHEEESIAWEHSTRLVRFLFRDYFAFDDSELFNPNMMSFFQSEAPDFFADLGAPKSIEENDLARALDTLIARLLRNPETDLSEDPHLKTLLDRFPTTAYSAKVLVLRAVQGKKDKESSRGGGGWSGGRL